jgi:hypothetical protein
MGSEEQGLSETARRAVAAELREQQRDNDLKEEPIPSFPAAAP